MVGARTGPGRGMVPFKGAAPSISALQGGHIDGAAVALGAIAGQLKSGVLRGIASSTKSPEFPNVPTLVELGYARDLLGVWLAFFAPAGVPPEVARVLVPAIASVATDPALSLIHI